MCKPSDKRQEHQERYRFWTDKRISQLSFYNNLLLTLGIALIGYFWSERSSIYTKLAIDFNEIDCIVTFFVLGLIFTGISVFAGFTLSLSRLYDLRLTSHIVLTRKRASDKSVNLIEEEIQPTARFRSLISVVWNYQRYEIKDSEIKDSEYFQNKFNVLRKKSSDLGYLTWKCLNWQTSTMLVAFIIFTFTLILK